MALFIDYNDIFPICAEDFNWGINYQRSENITHDLTSLCSNFYKEEGKNNLSREFSQHCQVHTLYLERIRTKIPTYKQKECCIYFYYKLNELLKKYPCNCMDDKSCYGKMESLSKKTFSDNISRIFLQCNNYINAFDESEIPMFKNLDKLYSLYNKFKRPNHPNWSDIENFIKCMVHLEGHINNYNDSFKVLLQRLNNKYIDFVKTLKETNSHESALLSYISDRGHITGILKNFKNELYLFNIYCV
ncbi:variable surface protein, partial [Plasmodium gonderi]